MTASLPKPKRGKGEKHAAAQADLHALGAEPAAPATTERTVTEPTFEGLTRAFVEGLPSLGIFSDEGGQFLGEHGMNSDNRQKTLAALNDLWGGNPIRRTRQGDGTFTLYGRRPRAASHGAASCGSQFHGRSARERHWFPAPLPDV